MYLLGLMLAIGISAVPGALAHGGGLNAEGCHNNRRTGDYHCHGAPAQRGLSALPLQKSPAESTQRRASTRSDTPVCHTGPRGGTYTLTSSGRKNYGGC
jgi:hypothetical protein